MELMSMTCRNCGGKLQIYKEADQVICQHCGTEYLVSINDGAISVKLLSEGLKKIQVSTDKTASELALVRIKVEKKRILNEIERAKNNLSQSGIDCLKKVDWNNTEEFLSSCETNLEKEKKRLFFYKPELVADMEQLVMIIKKIMPQYLEIVAQEQYHNEIVNKK